MNVTCHIIFCMIARVIPRISLQNFMKTYRNFLTKTTENVRPSPPKKNKTRNSPKQTAISARKFFGLTTIGVIKNICTKVHKKPNGYQEIERKISKNNKK